MKIQTAPVGLPPSEDQLQRAIATLLPGLRSRNYAERWADNSPATQALGVLCKYMGEEFTAGDLLDPEFPTKQQRPPEAEIEWCMEYMVVFGGAVLYLGNSSAKALAKYESFPNSTIEQHRTADLDWEPFDAWDEAAAGAV